ncbi:MAG: class I SAM-dependent methyltransferase [archaeon GB-1867-035]|nr:class I SAM-dependent methyltransferase [Candidatus Culexmicrobium profundum]
MENKKLVITKYNTTWKSYDELYGEEQNKKYETILSNLTWTRKIKRIMDIGCGTGNFMNKIINKTKYTVGIDLSKNMLKEAKRKIRKNSWKTSLILADAENIPIKNNCIDLTFAITLIQNLPNPEKFLIENSRILRNKGKAIITAIKRIYKPEDIERIIQSNKKLKITMKINLEDVADIILFCKKLDNN